MFGTLSVSGSTKGMSTKGTTRTFEIAFPEVKRNLVKRTLLPLFGFREPEHLTLGISQRTLSAKIFLAANSTSLFHALHSCVKPIGARTIAESRR